MEELSTKVRNIVGQVVDDINLIPDNNIELVGMMSSLAFVKLIVELETTFGIEIKDEDFDLEKMSTIEKITHLVASYLA